jgi:hypothetical protein
MCAWVRNIALRLAPTSDGFYSRLLSEFDRRISFPLALTFYPSAAPCQGRALSRINTKTPERSSTAAIGMQEGDNHAFYRSLSENNGHAR